MLQARRILSLTLLVSARLQAVFVKGLHSLVISSEQRVLGHSVAILLLQQVVEVILCHATLISHIICDSGVDLLRKLLSLILWAIIVFIELHV